MSIKLLAAIVLLLVSGVFASTRCYLAAERSLHAGRPAVQPDCSCCLVGDCLDATLVETQRDTRRPLHRQALAVRRRDGATANAPVAPAAISDACAVAPRGS